MSAATARPARLTITSPVQKTCPYRLEADHGTLVLTFDLAEGDGPELHGLAGALDDPDWEISHEDYTRAMYDGFRAEGCVRAESTWLTAGLAVTVEVGESCATSRTPAQPGCVTP